MIKLNDLLRLTDDEIQNCKVRFHSVNQNGENPVDYYLKNPDTINKVWHLYRSERNRYYVGETAMSLLRVGWNMWLLTTIALIKNDLGTYDDVAYESEELEKYASFYGRTIIRYDRGPKEVLRKLEGIIDALEVMQILPSQFDGIDFPGYDNVCVSFKELATIISRQKRDWINALSNQKAVYLITDNHTGKQYVGSATSESDMLLARWSNYIANGHGGNVALKALIDEKGFDYVKENFQYSILENYNARVEDEFIKSRESWWKNVLGTREFGYNRN